MSNRADLGALAKKARQLPEPEDYFEGLGCGHTLLPDKILCFTRTCQNHDLSGYAGISARSGKYDQHSRVVLIVPLSGEGSVGVGANIFLLRPGNGLVVFPHELHYYTYLPDEFEWLFVTFEAGEGLAELEGLRGAPRRLSERLLGMLSTLVNVYCGWKSQQGGAAGDLGGESELAGREAGEISQSCEDWLEASLQLRGLLYQLLMAPTVDCESGAEEVVVRAGVDIVARIKALLFSNLDRRLSIGDVAGQVGFSESYVRAAFKQRVGISLGQFILAVRLTHSAYLLSRTESKIGRVAEACGFSSQLSFSRAFKRSFGYSPREYRKHLDEVGTRRVA